MNDLAGMLPAEAAASPYDRVGFNGDQLGVYGAAAGISDTELAPVLEQFGKTINDVNFAIATPAGGGSTAMIYALQIEGVDVDRVDGRDQPRPGRLRAADDRRQDGPTQGAGGFNVYAYPKGDAVFVLILGDDTLAEIGVQPAALTPSTHHRHGRPVGSPAGRRDSRPGIEKPGTQPGSGGVLAAGLSPRSRSRSGPS